jgi:phage terminase large subunit-like protein
MAAWSHERTGQPLYWWQVLAACRALEHDADGALVWEEVLLTTTRQVGKSHLLREAILWRLEHGLDLFNNPDETIVYTANRLDLSREIIRPAQSWAEDRNGWTVRRANGETRVEHPNGSRWMVRAIRSAGYGFTLTTALVDESWDVDPEIVDDQIGPTMVARESAQLWLVSTPHPEATDLFPSRRQTALATLSAPDTRLLIEWSADPRLDTDDEEAWRQSSPRWTERRKRFIALQYQSASEESFRCQWLAQWPIGGSRLRLADEEGWDAGLKPGLVVPTDGRPLTITLDAISGGGFSSVVGWEEDGLIHLVPRVDGNRIPALTYVSSVAMDHPGSILRLGASLEALVDPLTFPGEVALTGIRETRQATHLFQGLVSEGKVLHNGDPTLAQQVLYAVIVRTDVGPVLSGTRSPGPVDLARGAVWAAWSVSTRASQTPAVW